MGLTLVVELLAEWSIYSGYKFIWMYHVFVIAEYSLLCLYFIKVTVPKYGIYIRYSIIIFAAVSAGLSASMYPITHLPGLNINLEGMLLAVICSGVLFNLDSRLHPKIYQHPDFWICCGLLVFYSGTFFSFGLYSQLLALDERQALKLFSVVTKPLNLILYSCLITGFLCAMPRTSISRSF